MRLDKNLINRIKKEILEMVNKDQSLRYTNKLDAKFDRANSLKLKKIINQVGWPKKNDFGQEISSGAWLIVQHSDHDLMFQKECLKLMKQMVKEGQIDKKLVPFLEDRILVNEGKKQKYGTQFYKDKINGKLIPKPIKNLKNVDKLRISVGLEPIEVYAKLLQDSIDKIEKSN